MNSINEAIEILKGPVSTERNTRIPLTEEQVDAIVYLIEHDEYSTGQTDPFFDERVTWISLEERDNRMKAIWGFKDDCTPMCCRTVTVGGIRFNALRDESGWEIDWWSSSYDLPESGELKDRLFDCLGEDHIEIYDDLFDSETDVRDDYTTEEIIARIEEDLSFPYYLRLRDGRTFGMDSEDPTEKLAMVYREDKGVDQDKDVDLDAEYDPAVYTAHELAVKLERTISFR